MRLPNFIMIDAPKRARLLYITSVPVSRGVHADEVNRRQRLAKSDGLDVRKLLSMLMRFHHGAREVWRVVHVPSMEAEDQRHLYRDLGTLQSVS